MDAAGLLADLVAIDSVNPALVPGAAGEAQIAAFVAGWMERHGLDVTMIDEPAGRRDGRASSASRAGRAAARR